MKPAMTPQQERLTTESGLSAYRDIAVGDANIIHFLSYELITLLTSNLTGITGLGLRSLLYPLLFGSCGHRPAIGRGCIIRNPKKISLGSKVLIDDYASLDARGVGAEISLGDHVSVGRFSSVVSKSAKIRFGNGVNIGSYCRIASQSSIEIGESVLVAAYSYIGPGNHQAGDTEKPLISREMDIKGGVKIGAHAWIGAGATILDGVSIGEGAVIGAHSLVLESVPAGMIAAGSPAKVIKSVK